MLKNLSLKTLKIINAICFAVMIAINALANIIPINGLTTGEVSNLYPNLFTPPAYVFSIWGVIYLLLGAFVIYQFVGKKDNITDDAIAEISPFFIISSLANTLWILAWHYQMIIISLALMIIILACLIFIALILKKYNFDKKQSFFIKYPFMLYFGWITVATIANVTALLVSLGFEGGTYPQIWTVVVIITGLAISIITACKINNFVYLLPVIWAYAGIAIRHIIEQQYPVIYITAIISALILSFAAIKKCKCLINGKCLNKFFVK